MVQQHQHGYTAFPSRQSQGGGYEGSTGIVTQQNQYTNGLYVNNNTSLSGEETRPKNIYVNYLIYAGQF
jgi:hypothetical protein